MALVSAVVMVVVGNAGWGGGWHLGINSFCTVAQLANITTHGAAAIAAIQSQSYSQPPPQPALPTTTITTADTKAIPSQPPAKVWQSNRCLAACGSRACRESTRVEPVLRHFLTPFRFFSLVCYAAGGRGGWVCGGSHSRR